MNYNSIGDNKFTDLGYDPKARKGDCFLQTHVPLPRRQFWQKKKKKKISDLSLIKSLGPTTNLQE